MITNRASLFFSRHPKRKMKKKKEKKKKPRKKKPCKKKTLFVYILKINNKIKRIFRVFFFLIPAVEKKKKVKHNFRSE